MKFLQYEKLPNIGLINLHNNNLIELSINLEDQVYRINLNTDKRSLFLISCESLHDAENFCRAFICEFEKEIESKNKFISLIRLINIGMLETIKGESCNL
jgi:hypothetical protein